MAYRDSEKEKRRTCTLARNDGRQLCRLRYVARDEYQIEIEDADTGGYAVFPASGTQIRILMGWFADLHDDGHDQI